MKIAEKYCDITERQPHRHCHRLYVPTVQVGLCNAIKIQQWPLSMKVLKAHGKPKQSQQWITNLINANWCKCYFNTSRITKRTHTDTHIVTTYNRLRCRRDIATLLYYLEMFICIKSHQQLDVGQLHVWNVYIIFIHFWLNFRHSLRVCHTQRWTEQNHRSRHHTMQLVRWLSGRTSVNFHWSAPDLQLMGNCLYG